MSFHVAESADPILRGLPVILRGALTEIDYTPDQHQIYANMDSDPFITPRAEVDKPTCRADLLHHCVPHQSDLMGMRTAVNRFCYANQRQGPIRLTETKSAYGRVQRFDGVLNSLARSDSAADLADIEALLRDLISDGPALTRLDRQRVALNSTPLSQYQIWSYPAGDSDAPYAEIGDDRTEAVNLLGLGFFTDTDELVRWAHELPEPMRAHLPTAWDSAAESGSVYWRPGGRTYRLDRDEFGVVEVVHPLVFGRHLVSAIEPLL